MYTAGCRCGPCTTANREDAARRDRLKLYGRWNGLVDAAPARAHLAELSAQGIGWKRAALLAGLSTGAVSKLLYGGPGCRAPSKRVRPETEAAILAVRPRREDLAPSALVDATGTRRRLQALAAAGWPLARLAARLGWERGNLGAVMRQRKVTAVTAARVRELYDELWDQPCPAADAREREGIRRAVAHARRVGWAPPMAWDDEAMDDPRGRPKGLRRGEAA
jgi:hypothetical protein